MIPFFLKIKSFCDVVGCSELLPVFLALVVQCIPLSLSILLQSERVSGDTLRESMGMEEFLFLVFLCRRRSYFV